MDGETPPADPDPMFRFPSRLLEGTVVFRPNRFVMHVDGLAGCGPAEKCHCPCTSPIGPLQFPKAAPPSTVAPEAAVRCLVSPNKPGGKTSHTVEAIRVHGSPAWHGINQGRANRIFEHLLRTGQLAAAVPEATADNVEREKALKNARIDFLVAGSHFIEVKSPMTSMPFDTHPLYIEFDDKQRLNQVTERLIRHYEALGALLATRPTARASVFIMFQYDAPPFVPRAPPAEHGPLAERLLDLHAKLSAAKAAGVRTYQLNMRFSPDGVELVSCKELDLFASRPWQEWGLLKRAAAHQDAPKKRRRRAQGA